MSMNLFCEWVNKVYKGDKKMSNQTHREGQTKHIEREFEVGKDESWFANIKRLHDEFLHESLESIRTMRAHQSTLVSDAQQHNNFRQTVADQALQNAVETAHMVSKNAVETANMISKQAVRHTDLAIDRQWNVDEVASLVAKTGVETGAVIAALAGLVTRELSK